MKIKKIVFRNFKSLYDTFLEPGKVNVFIGANGSGKSTILEGIGVLSAAMTDRVDSNSLQRKGIRLSAASLYKSCFKNVDSLKSTVDLSVEWSEHISLKNHVSNDMENNYKYDVHLIPPKDLDYWEYDSVSFIKNQENILERSNVFLKNLNNLRKFSLYYDNLEMINELNFVEKFADYGIFQPNTLTLRGTVPDPNQMNPVGLNGGRLAEAVQDIINNVDDDLMFGSLYMDDILELIDWASEFSIDIPKKSSINGSIPTTRLIIEFGDRFMEDTVRFTGYDASEGALYVLFMLCLAIHPKTPSIFSVDNFDHALNPRLAKRLTEVFCEQVIKNDKCAFLTTHNPLVLDGLDLQNDDVRLFAVDRDKNGYAKINRIQVSEKLIKSGQSLSRLWINGRLGGVPETI